MSNQLSSVTIEQHFEKPVAIVLRGDVGIYCVDTLHELAEKMLQNQEDVEVFCEELTRLDASALQVILALRQDLQSQGRCLRLQGVSAEMKTLLQLAGVEHSFFSHLEL